MVNLEGNEVRKSSYKVATALAVASPHNNKSICYVFGKKQK